MWKIRFAFLCVSQAVLAGLEQDVLSCRWLVIAHDIRAGWSDLLLWLQPRQTGRMNVKYRLVGKRTRCLRRSDNSSRTPPTRRSRFWKHATLTGFRRPATSQRFPARAHAPLACPKVVEPGVTVDPDVHLPISGNGRSFSRGSSNATVPPTGWAAFQPAHVPRSC